MDSFAVDGYSRGSPEKIDRLIEEAKKCKEQGNADYGAKEYRKAIRNYHRALLYIKSITQGEDPIGTLLGMKKKEGLTRDMRMRIDKLRRDCHNNLAACIMCKAEPDYEKVITYCDLVVENDASNPKAHFRKGVALYHLKDYDRALASFLKAKECVSTADSQVTKYISLCHQRIREGNEKAKVTYQNMFKNIAT